MKAKKILVILLLLVMIAPVFTTLGNGGGGGGGGVVPVPEPEPEPEPPVPDSPKHKSVPIYASIVYLGGAAMYWWDGTNWVPEAELILQPGTYLFECPELTVEFGMKYCGRVYYPHEWNPVVKLIS